MYTMTTKTLIMLFLSVALLALGVKAMRNLKQTNPQNPIQQSSNQEVSELLGVLRDEKLRQREPDRVVEAIRKLGEIKSVAAIDDLVGLLTFKRTFQWESKSDTTIIEIQPITPANRYPAVGALTEIGNAALPALVRVLETHETGSLESQNALFVVGNVFREQPMEAVTYLREAASKSQTPLASERLVTAANRVTSQPRK